MHELGLINQTLQTVAKSAEENHIEKVQKIVLAVGEMSGAVPEFLEKAFPSAVKNLPMFQDCVLEIQMEKGAAECKNCGTEFELVLNDGKCPTCGGMNFHITKGKGLSVRTFEGE